MEAPPGHSRKRKAIQTSPSHLPASFEFGSPHERISQTGFDQPDQTSVAKKQRNSMIFHPLPTPSIILPRGGMPCPLGYPIQSFPSSAIGESHEIQGSRQWLQDLGIRPWSQCVGTMFQEASGSKILPPSHPISLRMEQEWDNSLVTFENSDPQPGPGPFSTSMNATYNLTEVSCYSDAANNAAGPNSSELAPDFSPQNNVNCIGDELYAMEFDDSTRSFEELAIPYRSWPDDDTFASGNEGSLLFPLQDIPFSNQTGEEPHTGHLTEPSSRNEVLRNDGMTDRLNVEMENAFTQPHSFQKVECIESPSQTPVSQKHQKAGRRTGPLSLEKAKKVALIRRLKACWRCWLSKIQCSTEEVCFTCRNSPTKTICNRTRLSEYYALFFPDQMVSHLQEEAVSKFITENVSSFRGSPIKISVSSGPTYPPMILSLREFNTTRGDFLDVQRIEKVDSDSEYGLKILTRKALPLGLPPSNISLLTKQCQQHIRSIISLNRNPYETEFGETSNISSKVLFAIERYRISSKSESTDSLLGKAAMLHAMHYFMGRELIVTESPGREACQDLLLSPDVPYDVGVPSRILSRQLKHVMHSLLRDLTQDVLRDLEKKLMKRTEALWAPCLCTILILCICVEEVQASIDGFAVYSSKKKAGEGAISREDGIGISRRLDDLLFDDCKVLFHGIYKSGKGSFGQKHESVFNPIRFEFQIDESKGLTQEMYNLVEDIRDILDVHGTEMFELASAPSIDSRDESLESHMKFRKRNSGRLVSDFLRSFLE